MESVHLGLDIPGEVDCVPLELEDETTMKTVKTARERAAKEKFFKIKAKKKEARAKKAKKKAEKGNPWKLKGWQKMPAPAASRWEILARVSYVFEQVANALDMLNILLVAVFAVVLDVSSFPTHPSILLLLVSLVVLSSVPPRFGIGLMIYFVEEGRKEKRRPVIIGLIKNAFWAVRITALVLEVAQLVVAVLPVPCEVIRPDMLTNVTLAKPAYCKAESGLSALVHEDATLFVLSIAIAEAVFRILGTMGFICLAWRSEDAGYFTFRVYRQNIPELEPNYLQMVAVEKIKLPSNSFYFARHVYDLQPYKGLLFAPHTLLDTGIVPDVLVSSYDNVDSYGLDKIQNSGREDVVAVDGLPLRSINKDCHVPVFETAGGGWWDYFGARQAYHELLEIARKDSPLCVGDKMKVVAINEFAQLCRPSSREQRILCSEIDAESKATSEDQVWELRRALMLDKKRFYQLPYIAQQIVAGSRQVGRKPFELEPFVLSSLPVFRNLMEAAARQNDP